MIRLKFLIAINFFSLSVIAQSNYKRALQLMGCDFEITVVAENPEKGQAAIALAVDEVRRIERLISSWDPNSQTAAINRSAGIRPVKVSAELFQLIARSKKISRLTDGAFDITSSSMDKLWRFDGSMKHMPTPQEIESAKAKVDYRNIVLDHEKQTVFLKRQGMKIGFGAIGKGYAADKAKRLLVENGVKGGLVNASGDMSAWGRQAGGDDWTVAVTNPLNKKAVFAFFPLRGRSAVTSGDYEKFVEFGDKRYSHIINPKTGYPAQGVISVTVLAPKAEIADALATSVFVMGVEAGLHRINQLPGVECVIVDDQGVVHRSAHLQAKKL